MYDTNWSQELRYFFFDYASLRDPAIKSKPFCLPLFHYCTLILVLLSLKVSTIVA